MLVKFTRMNETSVYLDPRSVRLVSAHGDGSAISMDIGNSRDDITVIEGPDAVAKLVNATFDTKDAEVNQ